MAPYLPPSLAMVILSSILAFACRSYFWETSLTSLFLSYFFACAVVRFIYSHVVYPKYFSPLRHLPEIKSCIPWYGHGFKLFGLPVGSFVLDAMNTIPNDGLIRFTMLGSERLVPTKPHTLSEVTQKLYEYERPEPVRELMTMFFGRGLLNSEGDEHKFQRRHVQPGFTVRAIRDLGGVFWTKATQLVDAVTDEISSGECQPGAGSGGIESKASTGVVEINRWATTVTMDIIGLACLGWDMNGLGGETNEILESYVELMEPSPEKSLWNMLHLLGFGRLVDALPWRVSRNFRLHAARLRANVRRVVKEKKASVKAAGDDGVDILSILIRSNDFSDVQLEDLVLNFLSAGHETTAATFSWLIYHLAHNPTLQSTLRSEIRAALPDPSSVLNPSSTLSALPLLAATLAETLRLHPSVPLSSRNPSPSLPASRPTTIAGHPVPRTARVALVPYAVNRCAHTWGPDAEDFRPGRWLRGADDATAAAATAAASTVGVTPSGSNYDVLTFLHGARSCVGQGFARAELRALVAAFAGTFEWEMAVPGDVVGVAGVVAAKPAREIRVRVRRLGGW